MKEILLTVAVGLVLIFGGFSMGFPQMIKAPSPEVAKEIAAFSGKWKGAWSGGGVDFTLIVREITAEKALVTYANKGNQNFVEASNDVEARVIPGSNPKIQFNLAARGVRGGTVNCWFTFEMQRDLRTLKGVADAGPMSGKATLEKIE